MNFIKKDWQKLVLLFYTLMLPVFSLHAACDPTAGKICNPLGTNATDIPTFIQNLLVGVLKLGIPVVALAIIYSGFLFVFARGKEKKLTEAKDTLLWTIVGAAVLLGAWAIALMIQATVTGLSATS
jgi:hypothetical protein